MASYTGILSPSIFVEDVLRCSATIIDNTVVSPVEIGALESVIPLAAGARGDNLPVSMNARGLTGRKVDSFLDDYYYRFHVVEATFEYPSIVAEIEEQFILWNAWFVQKNCTEIAEVEGDEFELTGLTAPLDLNALAYTTYTIAIPIEGDTDFDASITFDFSGADNPVVTISGSRPNLLINRWTWPVTERLGFNTEILQSHNRTEQRIAKRRGVPKRDVATRLFVEDEDECARLEAVLQKWLKRPWIVPLWFEAEKHTGNLPAASSSLVIDTRYADFRAGSYAFIWGSANNYEAVWLDTVGDSLLTLLEPTLNAYDGIKWIMPLRTGRVIEAGKLRRYHGGALMDIAWRIEDVQTVTGFVADMTYDGYTVLTEPAVLPGDAGEFSHDPDIAVLDAGTGPFEIVSNSDFNEAVQSHGWRPQTKQAAWWLRQLLHNIKGRQAAFLVPTFKYDLELTRPVGPSETNIYIRNVGAAANMGLNDLRTYLAFRPAGASVVPRKVTGISVIDAAEELITINTAPGVAFEPGESLCWVDRCRLANDEIELTWHGVGKCEADTPLVRISS